MRILFAASPEISCPALRFLAQSSEVEIAGVLTNAPSFQGRGKNLLPTPVFCEAEKIKRDIGLDFQIFTPERLTQEFCDEIASKKIDLLVCFAYGKIFRPNFLRCFSRGGINFHPSLLPKFRGPAPIPAAIRGRAGETGWTVQRIAEKMDSGDILLQEKFSLDGTETTKSLYEKISPLAGEAILKVVLDLQRGKCDETPQNEADATYCHLIAKDDAKIDWKNSAAEIDAQIRAYNPEPIAFTTCGEKRLFLHYSSLAQASGGGKPGEVVRFDKGEGFLIQCGEGAIWAKTLQWQAKKALGFKDFFNGNQNLVGRVLGE